LVIGSKIFFPGELHYIKVGFSDRQLLETMDACFVFVFPCSLLVLAFH